MRKIAAFIFSFITAILIVIIHIVLGIFLTLYQFFMILKNALVGICGLILIIYVFVGNWEYVKNAFLAMVILGVGGLIIDLLALGLVNAPEVLNEKREALIHEIRWGRSNINEHIK